MFDETLLHSPPSFLPALSVAATSELLPPADYLHSKLQQNDIVFLGTTHKKPEILSFIADSPSLKGRGVSHVGLEIPSDQQEKIDVFMKAGQGLDDINLHTQIDSPEYRHPFQVFRKSGGPIPVAMIYPVPCTKELFPVMNGWYSHC